MVGVRIRSNHEIVPPGTTINPADGGWVSPALQAAARRR
jgi:hypothetical protein